MDRTKAALNRDKAGRLMSAWKVPVAQARYRETGDWYALLSRFPAALVDASGYLLFASEEDYKSSPFLSLGKQISIRGVGISAAPGYVRMLRSTDSVPDDVDIHEAEETEGRMKLLLHLTRERRRGLVLKKKKAAASLSCEVCEFSFAAFYGELAAEYCEVHHLVPLSEAEQQRKTSLKDLAVLCANCHRVVHLRNPPFTLQEVKAMLRGKQ